MSPRRHNLHDRGKVLIPPSKAQYRLVTEEVADYEYVIPEELPDLEHGIVWAHSLGASPPDVFGELIAWINHKIEEAMLQRERRSAKFQAGTIKHAKYYERSV